MRYFFQSLERVVWSIPPTSHDVRTDWAFTFADGVWCPEFGIEVFTALVVRLIIGLVVEFGVGFFVELVVVFVVGLIIELVIVFVFGLIIELVVKLAGVCNAVNHVEQLTRWMIGCLVS